MVELVEMIELGDMTELVFIGIWGMYVKLVFGHIGEYILGQIGGFRGKWGELESIGADGGVLSEYREYIECIEGY